MSPSPSRDPTLTPCPTCKTGFVKTYPNGSTGHISGGLQGSPSRDNYEKVYSLLRPYDVKMEVIDKVLALIAEETAKARIDEFAHAVEYFTYGSKKRAKYNEHAASLAQAQEEASKDD